MDNRELLTDLRNIIPTIVLDSIANLYKSKIIPSHKDVELLREDVLDLINVCVSEMEETINHNAEVVEEESKSITTQDRRIVAILNNHAKLIETQAKEISKLRTELRRYNR